MSEKVEKRENHIDKFVTTFFDNLWTNSVYLDFMGKNLDTMFEVRKQWNKNMENLLGVLQLPNQTLQQKTLHNVNTLITEWRFEQEELKLRLDKIEKDIDELKKPQSHSVETLVSSKKSKT